MLISTASFPTRVFPWRIRIDWEHHSVQMQPIRTSEALELKVI